ncbi:uncharacterized protein LOC110871651 isoform X2 [Helianthus annuus]|uniref:uncharacterized protein LOC110871651 isoform X2 n=1 Tax=Helianthus annuus TaxID=4232 RepID=UPI000B8FD6A6|nr:uncharacterized protein LOC110871651 isoform X2 [Helianthus annuus]
MKTEDYKRRGILRLPGSCRSFKKTNEWMSAAVTIIVGIVFGFFIGVSFPDISPPKLKLVPSIDTYIGDKNSGRSTQTILNVISVSRDNVSTEAQKLDDPSQIFVPTNPRGAERLPPAIVASESDFYPRRLYGRPSEDPTFKPKYLVTFTVGYDQKDNIDQAVKKFSDNFTILLFHYDGRTTEWDEFAWSKRAIHISVPKQTKWWYAKRFLHPDIVAPYDFIFIWDEDLGVENFDAEEYIKLVKKHKLEISQPGLDLKSKGLTWHMTKRQEDLEVHKFVEIMAPVFSRETWRCVWYLIQNDLVHGWGLDFALQKCVEPAYERIGVVDAQWIVHQGVPSLGNQGNEDDGKARWRGVRERCKNEWKMFQDRVYKADEDYYKSIGVENMVPEANWVNMDKVQ